MNTAKTFMLLAAMTAIFMGVGYLIGGTGGIAIAFVVAAGTPDGRPSRRAGR